MAPRAATSATALPEHGQHRPTDGEGESEGEGAVAQSLITDDAAYLSRLHLILGHLEVGVSLYRKGHTAAALTHMKHPADELYSALIPAIAARGVTGFDGQLEAPAQAVAGGADAEASTLYGAAARVELAAGAL
ncbi:MAG: hypothetical protein RIB46_20760 [Pseudomonadales bacterium]